MSKRSYQTLYAIADRQQGFFTTKQAITAGYSDATHPYHVNNGEWSRRYRGIYQLVHYPAGPESEYVLWALWSRDREERVQGVYSHATALSIHDLSDLDPIKLHLSVPKRFRKGSEIPTILYLHYESLEAQHIEERQGFRVLKPLFAILQLIREQKTPEHFLSQALREGLQRGLIQRREIKKVNFLDPKNQKLFDTILKDLS